MGIPFTIQSEDNRQLKQLQKLLGAPTKIDVLRRGLLLLYQQVEKERREIRWHKAVKLVRKESAMVNAQMRAHSRFKRVGGSE